MKKKKISFKNLIYDNRFVLALSIIAAVIIWIVVAIQASPEDDRIIKDVPVKIEISKLRPPSGAVYSWWGAVPRKAQI